MMTSLAIQLLTVSVAVLQRQTVHNNAASRTSWNSQYDYIIVGGGSAGSVLASRLTQDGQSSVLLLEAGGPGSVITDMPANALTDIDPRDNDWGYSTVPQANMGLYRTDRRITFPRGRVLGGSSVTNYMIYNRGNRRDFDNWADNYGLPEWSYDNLLPYFRRSEHMYNTTIVEEKGTLAYHGTDGPLAVSIASNADPIHEHWIRAWNLAGYNTTDANGPEQVGIRLFQQTIDPRTWTRASTAYAFLYPVVNRTNLHIVTGAHVTQVLIRNSNETYGVQFRRDGLTYEVTAAREVILSAGAINTPQILMLSGIGPRQELEQFRINVVADLPVGQRFQDHLLVPLSFTVNNESDIQWSRARLTAMNVENMYNYYVHETGPLTQTPLTGGYYSTANNPDPEWPDTVSALVVTQLGQALLGAVSQTTDPIGWRQYIEPLIDNPRHFLILVGVFRIYSRGTVRLASTNPMDAPLIDPSYFSDQRDFTAIVSNLQHILQIADGEFFRQHAQHYSTALPGCEADVCVGVPLYQCPKYLGCYARQLGTTSWHPVATATMGTDASNSVVDSQLRVHGISNLRVIDASVMPEVPNGNTNAPTIAISEYGSDLILQARN